MNNCLKQTRLTALLPYQIDWVGCEEQLSAIWNTFCKLKICVNGLKVWGVSMSPGNTTGHEHTMNPKARKWEGAKENNLTKYNHKDLWYWCNELFYCFYKPLLGASWYYERNLEMRSHHLLHNGKILGRDVDLAPNSSVDMSENWKSINPLVVKPSEKWVVCSARRGKGQVTRSAVYQLARWAPFSIAILVCKHLYNETKTTQVHTWHEIISQRAGHCRRSQHSSR